VDPDKLVGKLIVVEGADGSGRSTQIARLVTWLEGAGTPRCRWAETVHAGERRTGAGSEGNILSHLTMSLFYATDFADQLENIILPALKAGSWCWPIGTSTR